MAPNRSRPSPALRGAACALACTLLVACAVLPEPDGEQVRNQALSTVAIPPNWSAQALQSQVDQGWLASFEDPRLTELVHQALQSNPDLLIAAARVEQANAQVDIARSQLMPAVGLIGRAGSKPIADLVPLLSGIMLRVSWELDLWGRLRYARNAAIAASDAENADYRYAQQSLAASVARAWFVATEARQQQQLAEQMADHGLRLVALAEQRERTGIGSNTETLTARASTASYLDASEQAKLAHLSAVRALELLLGRYPGATLQTADTLPAVPPPVPAGIPADMLNRRPDLFAAERRVAAAFDRVGEARAAMLPTLSLSAGYGRLSNEVIETREDLEQTTSSVAATGVMPLYTGGALTGQVRLRSAEQKQAVADYTRRALLALAEVEDSLSAERVLTERERVLADSLAANRQATLQVRDSWRIGKSDMRAVHAQEMATLAAQSALLGVQREHLSRRLDLHLALGGDFGPPPALATE
ncbi:efflux transporter outer membrane subunit [Pseudoxanthomonas indica]|uniref:Efflux transporter, outer membrane factor (OMF) lipoprotein, NodT family n=1 Tax=Pseudoxanthomonas indica TaxID=428993 RepID=A0A1T5M1R9_9GAMM|nr:efflux transporter outer membrane subunit [Pseudoxanthomonas indica]GGD60383.1 transporter [Pseudoxanthomonas indica]SKC82083.1 efflux transporter, outer membrane factor (OMF) lipoprotein, NodT family [Pseudoxanthomonas indica]